MFSLKGPHCVLRMNAMHILWRLSKGDDYCYSLAKAFEPDKPGPKPSHTNLVRIYLMLQYLKKRGFVKFAPNRPEGSRERKMYSITPNGSKELGNYKNELKSFFGDYITYLSE
jgi:DNA-binding PadR family transcriptional regulator